MIKHFYFIAPLCCCPLHSPQPYRALLPGLASSRVSWPKSPFLGCLTPCLSCRPEVEVDATVNELSNMVKRVMGKAHIHHLNHIPSSLPDPKSTMWHASFFLVRCGRFDSLPLSPLGKGPDYPWI